MNKFLVVMTVVALIISFCAASADKYDSYLDYGKAVAGLGSEDKGLTDKESAAARLLMRSYKPMTGLDGFGALAVVAGPQNHYTLQFATVDEAKKCMAKLKLDENVKYVQQDAIVSIGKVEAKPVKPEAKAESPYMSWGAKAMGADELAGSINAAGSVTVAVIDTGVARHDFLDSRVKHSGADFYDPSNSNGRSDGNGHGTHVAGTVVDLTQGVKVNILPIRALGDEGQGSLSGVCNGMRYAAESGAKVINMSLGDSLTSPYAYSEMTDAVSYAEYLDVSVVVAAGNESDDAANHSPACEESAITVAALETNLTKAGYSNYGDPIDVAAPGSQIVSCAPNGGFVSLSGTSMACPHTAAIVAMIRLKYPNYSADKAESYLKDNCLDLGEKGWDKYYGYGMPCYITGVAGVEGDYEYRIVSGEAIITKYTGSEAEVVIPETLGSLPVVALDADAFMKNANLSSVTVPGCVKEIGDYAFSDCENLKSVTLGEGVIKLGAISFANCLSLESVQLPETLRDIDIYAFWNCPMLAEIELPDSLRSLGEYCFALSGLKKIRVPGGVKTICDYTFYDCDLEEVILEEGVDSIKSYSFAFCEKLEHVSLPESLKSLGASPFFYSALKTIEMPGMEKLAKYAFYGVSNLVRCDLPESVESIPKEAFAGCVNLERLTLGRGISSIKENAFINCPKLTLYLYKYGYADEFAEKYGLSREYIGYQNTVTLLEPVIETTYSEPGQRLSVQGCLVFEPAEATGNIEDIEWTIADPSICKVVQVTLSDDTKQMFFEMLAEGETSVTGKVPDDGGLSVTMKFVSDRQLPREVRFDRQSLTLAEGETAQITYRVLPESASQQLIWVTSDEAVATVSETGLVTAVGAGQAEIVAHSKFGWEINSTCLVTVVAAQPVAGAFTYGAVPGGVSITGYTGTATEISIPSMIDGNAVVGIASNAFAEGKFTEIRISEGIKYIEDGAFARNKALKSVRLPDSLEQLAMNAFKGCGKLKKVQSLDFKIISRGEGFIVRPLFTPADTAAAWSLKLSKKGAADIRGDMIAPATADSFSVTLKSGGKKAVLGFKDMQPFAATKISISGKAKRTLKMGGTLSLLYKVKPASAKIIAAWQSADPAVATVDSEGLVTPVAPGKTLITLTTDAGLTASVTVTVK